MTENKKYDSTYSILVDILDEVKNGGGSCNLQEVSTTITTNGPTTITADPGFDGISTANVTVAVPEPYLIPLEVTQNGTYVPEMDVDGYSDVIVNVPEQKPEEVGNETIVSNGKVKFTPTAGSVFSEMNVDVQVPIPEIKLQEKSVTSNGPVTPDSGFDGLSKVDVNVPTGGGAGPFKIASVPGVRFKGSVFTTFTNDDFDFSGVQYMNNMFTECEFLTNIPLIDTSSVTTMYYLFNGCKALITIPELNTSKVENMAGLFWDCISLTNIPLIDTSSVTDMRWLFSGCTNLTSIPQLDTSSVTDMYRSFQRCENITTIPQLNTSKVENMEGLVYRCTNLTSIPQLDMSLVTNAKYMLHNCSSLTDLGGFKGLKVNLDLSYSPLTHDSIMNVINEAATVTDSPTLTFGSTNLAKITEEEKAIATNKGWVLA